LRKENSTRKSFNFLINSSNQANLSGVSNVDARQINTVFVLIAPYYIDRFNMEGLDMNIRVDEEGVLWVDKQSFEPIEIARGVKIIGIIQR
jgi:hypothetical protein